MSSGSIVNIVNSLNDTSGGHIEIPTKVVKKIMSIISQALSTIFNLCITKGYFSDILKIAHVTLIFKANDRKIMNNYESISVLPVFNKIF